MYNNIGRKIKILAKVLFVFELIGALVSFIVFAAIGLIGAAVTTLFGTPVVALISSWLLYGYGQLIENSDIVAEEYKRVNKKHEKVVEKKNAEKQEKAREKAKAMISDADVADEEFIDVVCLSCKAKLSYTKGQINSNEPLICPMCNAHIFF